MQNYKCVEKAAQKRRNLHKPSLPPGGRGTAAGFPETSLRVFGVRAKAVKGDRATSG